VETPDDHTIKIRCGWGKGNNIALIVKHPAHAALTKTQLSPGTLLEGNVSNWKRLAVRTTTLDRMRMWMIEPGPTPNEFKFGPYYAPGPIHHRPDHQ
jgi:hypothetical protein